MRYYFKVLYKDIPIVKKLVGKYYTVIGPRMDRYILVDSIEQKSQVDTALINDLLTKVEVA